MAPEATATVEGGGQRAQEAVASVESQAQQERCACEVGGGTAGPKPQKEGEEAGREGAGGGESWGGGGRTRKVGRDKRGEVEGGWGGSAGKAAGLAARGRRRAGLKQHQLGGRGGGGDVATLPHPTHTRGRRGKGSSRGGGASHTDLLEGKASPPPPPDTSPEHFGRQILSCSDAPWLSVNRDCSRSSTSLPGV